RIEARAAHRRVASLRGLARWLSGPTRIGPRSLVIAIVALLAIAAAVAAIGLGVPGIRIELRPLATQPALTASASPGSPSIASSAPTAEIGADIKLGPIVTLEEARQTAGFKVLVPAVPGYRGPTEVHLLGNPPIARVSLVYDDQTMVTEFVGSADPD